MPRPLNTFFDFFFDGTRLFGLFREVFLPDFFETGLPYSTLLFGTRCGVYAILFVPFFATGHVFQQWQRAREALARVRLFF